jgi:hypothetical protein
VSAVTLDIRLRYLQQRLGNFDSNNPTKWTAGRLAHHASLSAPEVDQYVILARSSCRNAHFNANQDDGSYGTASGSKYSNSTLLPNVSRPRSKMASI